MINFKSKILLIHSFTAADIATASFGATRLIKEQIIFLRRGKHHVLILEKGGMQNLSALLYKFVRLIRQRGVRVSSKLSCAQKWSYTLMYWIIREWLSVFDIFFSKIKVKIDEPFDIIHHYPSSLKYSISKKIKAISTIYVYEHNIEWKFYEDKIGAGFLGKLLIQYIKHIELKNLNYADKIICVTEADKQILVSEGGVSEEKIDVWVALPTQEKGGAQRCHMTNENKNVLIGFIGTNFEPNIISVNRIINIAKKIGNSTAFNIIGSVQVAFKDRNDLPDNVRFLGFVDNLKEELDKCNAFINPKKTSDTGIEIKMFDYLMLNRPILCTLEGARGYEKLNNVVILKDDKEIINYIKTKLCAN